MTEGSKVVCYDLSPAQTETEISRTLESLGWVPPWKEQSAYNLLREIVDGLGKAYISSWQSTHCWQDKLDAARAFLGENDD